MLLFNILGEDNYEIHAVSEQDLARIKSEMKGEKKE
jgi:hypothetical protein